MAKTSEEKKAWRRKYYQQNKERLDANHSRWVHEHAEQLRAYHNTEWMKAYRRKYYQGHREHMNAQSLANASKRQQWLRDYKRNLKCSRCGESFPDYPGIIEFHHEGEGAETRDHVISSLLKHSASMARLQAEIAKCVPLCANCHRRLHIFERQKKEGV